MILRLNLRTGKVLGLLDTGTDINFILNNVPLEAEILTKELIKKGLYIYYNGVNFSLYCNYKFTTFDGAGDYEIALEKLCQKLGYQSVELIST